MKLFDLFTKSSLAAFLLTMAFMYQPGTATAQSRDENNPTPIASFPVTGSLGSGTYYYEVPESAVGGGAATAVLDLTLPDGGGSMTVTFSGRLCCPPEAYIGVTTGIPDRRREATTFNIPRQQPILVTVYISVGAKQTIGFRLNFTNGSPSSSGVIVTPPAPRPTPPPALPDAALCTDLAIRSFVVIPVTSRSKKISGDVFNITTTHPYKGYAGRQAVSVFDITDSVTRPHFVTRILLPEIISPGGSFHFATVHNVTAPRRTRYEIRIGYSHLNATDASPYNDDCNTANNTTRRELINAPLDENNTVPLLEPAPKRP